MRDVAICGIISVSSERYLKIGQSVEVEVR